ncbi:MAG TPA: carboxy terminal-processing peptidase [Pirellulaceae bacterium]|mgnify:CR=1 FL=1|nr:carboxy terminal-processing peptidase [Pirellulaceae bacterium]
MRADSHKISGKPSVAQKRWLAYSLGFVLFSGLSAAWLTLPAAPLDGPARSDRRVTLVVKSFMEQEHLSRHPLDDEISARAMKAFLEGLDPRKMYFLQSDVDEFMTKERQIDNQIQDGDVRFAYTIFNRFLTRLDERVLLVDKLVDQPHDFTVDESIITDPDALRYPRSADEVVDRWRKLVKLNLLTFKADETSEEEARMKIKRRYHSLAKRWHQTDTDELLERFLTAVTSSYDPHTTYMSPSSLDNFRIMMRLNLDGIGAALMLSEEGYTEVTKIIPGGAADKDGRLKPEDRIVSVSDSNGEMIDVVDMKLNDVVQLIRGDAGTVVKLGVQAAGAGETKIYDITRARIELEDSAAQSEVLQRGQKPDGKPFNVGVIDLPSFYMDMAAAGNGQDDFRSTTRDVTAILNDFKSKNVDVVVLDLRRNGGGSLTEAINLTGLFIDQGPVVQVKDAIGRIQSYNDLDRGMAWDGPLVVLTSKFSASASEILAGAIQDYHRGLIIGDESTHGKGTVQSLLDLGSQIFRSLPNPQNLGALKITMQQFYRPNGDSTQKRGVIPDVILPSLTNAIAMGEGDLDYAVDFDRVDTAQFEGYNMVGADALNRLRSHSTDRIKTEGDFAKELERIARYKRMKDEKTISLNEEKYLARRAAERDAEKEEEKHFEDQQGNKEREIFADDFYNKEIVNITLDYLKELENNKVARVR